STRALQRPTWTSRPISADDSTQPATTRARPRLRAGRDAVVRRLRAGVERIVQPGVHVDAGGQDVIHVRRPLVAEHLELPHARCGADRGRAKVADVHTAEDAQAGLEFLRPALHHQVDAVVTQVQYDDTQPDGPHRVVELELPGRG